MITFILGSILVQKAEALARRASNHDIGHRELRARAVKDLRYVAGNDVCAEIAPIRLNCESVEIVGPDRGKITGEGKSKRHPARTTE